MNEPEPSWTDLDDLSDIEGFPPDVMDQCIAALPELLAKPRTQMQLFERIHQIAESFGERVEAQDAALVLHTAVGLALFLEVNAAFDLSLADWKEQLRARKEGSAIELNSLQWQLLEKLWASRSILSSAIAEHEAHRGVSPTFEDLSFSVELRPVYNISGISAFASQRPLSISNLIPVATLHLELDSGFPGAIDFQLAKGQVEELRAKLDTLLHRIEQLEAFAAGRGSHNPLSE